MTTSSRAEATVRQRCGDLESSEEKEMLLTETKPMLDTQAGMEALDEPQFKNGVFWALWCDSHIEVHFLRRGNKADIIRESRKLVRNTFFYGTGENTCMS